VETPDKEAGDKLKVLIVDADPMARHALASALQRGGCEVLEATSFDQGKRLLASESPAVLIADVRLGQFNGLQLLLRAKADREDIKVVITSVLADTVLEGDTRRFGGTFLVKPLKPAEILRLLRPVTEGVHSPESVDRRVADRRRLVIPSFTPDRRSTDRRRTVS
jgi:DNA-binding response OmpR family regulator